MAGRFEKGGGINHHPERRVCFNSSPSELAGAGNGSVRSLKGWGWSNAGVGPGL
jgi:hypothetical protein